MQTIWYRVIDDCEDSCYDAKVSDLYDLADEWDQEWIAVRCAEDYYSANDGWESDWPLTFTLHATEEGPEVARLNIDRETAPVQFSASHVKTPND